MILETAISALVGLLGTSLTTYSNYKMKKLEVDNQIRLLEAESKLMIAEAEASIKVAQTNAALEAELAEAIAFNTSVKQGLGKSLPSEWLQILMNQKGWWRILTYPIGVLLLLLMGLGDVINHLMRPTLTLYSLGIASWVTYQCWDMLPNGSGTVAHWEEAATIVMMLAVTMVTWWFGDRRVAKHLMHMKDKKNA